MTKAIVIGAGVGGLATAIRLAKKGYAVEVFEANDYVGGKLSTFNLGDYRDRNHIDFRKRRFF